MASPLDRGSLDRTGGVGEIRSNTRQKEGSRMKMLLIMMGLALGASAQCIEMCGVSGDGCFSCHQPVHSDCSACYPEIPEQGLVHHKPLPNRGIKPGARRPPDHDKLVAQAVNKGCKVALAEVMVQVLTQTGL